MVNAFALQGELTQVIVTALDVQLLAGEQAIQTVKRCRELYPDYRKPESGITMSHPTLTLTTKTIHNPDEPRHFMRAKAVNRVIEVQHQGETVARSENALRVTELGRDMLDPIFYIPRADVLVELKPVANKTTYCPLKGHASYFCIHNMDEPIVWSYEEPRDFADVLAGYVAFYPDHVVVTEIGAKAGRTTAGQIQRMNPDWQSGATPQSSRADSL